MKSTATGSAFYPGFLPLMCLLLALVCGCSESRDPAAYLEDLKSEDESTRQTAVAELIRMHEEAVPAVTAALESEHPGVRRGAVNVLAESRVLDSLVAVGRLLEEPDPDAAVRCEAVRAVAKLGPVDKFTAARLLARALDDQDEECIMAAAEGFIELDYADAAEVLQETMNPAEGLKAVYAAYALYDGTRNPEAADFLLAEILDESGRRRKAAQSCLEKLADRFVDVLLERLSIGEGQGLVAALVGQVRDGLIEELDTNLTLGRMREILAALGKIADDASVDTLIKFTRKDGIEIRARVLAAEALGQAALSPRMGRTLMATIGSSLKENLGNEKLDQRIRTGSAISLCWMRDSIGVDYLLGQLSKEEGTTAEVRIRAQEGLTSSGHFVVPFLLGGVKAADASDALRWAAAKTFGELEVDEAVPVLADFLTAAGRVPGDAESAFRYRGSVRWTAAHALGQIGTGEALEVLKEALSAETDPHVMFYIRHAVEKLQVDLSGEGTPAS